LNLREGEAAAWVQQMCSAIAFLHTTKRICHRDIKPDNFMVSEGPSAGKDGSGGVLKLADFGLAVFLPPGQVLSEKCGTPAFMSPEQHLLPKRSRGYGFPVDVWAAGISMYQMMCGGRHPFLNDRAILDHTLLLRAELDFKGDTQKARSDGPDRSASGLRFSDEARDLCIRMVDRDASRRIAARDVVGSSWCNGGQPSFSRRALTSVHGAGVACGLGGAFMDPPAAAAAAARAGSSAARGQGWRAPFAWTERASPALRARSEEFQPVRTRSFTTDDVPELLAQHRSAPPASGPWVQKAFESVFQPPAFLAELTSCGCGLQPSRSFASEAPSSPIRATSSPHKGPRRGNSSGGLRQLSLQPNDPANPYPSRHPDKVQQAVSRPGNYRHADASCRKDAGPAVLNEALVAVPSGSRY